MPKCPTCDDLGAVEWPESPFPCPDCRPAEFLVALVDYCDGNFGPYQKDAVRVARKVMDSEGAKAAPTTEWQIIAENANGETVVFWHAPSAEAAREVMAEDQSPHFSNLRLQRRTVSVSEWEACDG